jgi:hypothetical protein
MFKLGSFEEELMKTMESKLAQNQTETKYQINKIAKAIDYLNAAAEIFDKSGNYTEANEILEILQSFATPTGNLTTQDTTPSKSKKFNKPKSKSPKQIMPVENKVEEDDLLDQNIDKEINDQETTASALNTLFKMSKKWKDKMHGGLADKKNPKDFNRKALKKGIKVEREHAKSIQIAMEIAMDHLTEDPKYYDMLAKMEKE